MIRYDAVQVHVFTHLCSHRAGSWVPQHGNCVSKMLFPLAHEVHETGTDSMRVVPQHYLLELVCTNLFLCRTPGVSQALVSYYRCVGKATYRVGLKFLWKLYVLFERITHGRERENFTNSLISLILARTPILEAFKNIMVVMISTGTFDRVSRKVGRCINHDMGFRCYSFSDIVK